MIKSKDCRFLLWNIFLWSILIGSYYMSYMVSAVVLLFMLSWSFIYLKKRSSLLSIKIMFSVFYLGSLCLAVMRLVGIYEVVWSLPTWILLFFFYEFFYLGYFISEEKKDVMVQQLRKYTIKQGKQVDCAYALFVFFSVLAVLGFGYCVVISGYIPLFSRDVHAYTEFGNGSNLVLFYQIAVILPAIGLYLFKHKKRRRLSLILLIGIDIIICVMVKSRDFLVGMVIVAACMYYYEYAVGDNGKLKRKSKIIIVFSAFLVGAFFLWVSAQRGYSDSYIRWLYKAQDSILPDALVSPYVYITSGYYNFDSLVKGLDFHTYGLMTINPILILFHITPLREMSFVYKECLQQYYIIPELNLFSSLGVPYIDGGWIGIVLTAFLSGFIYSIFEINYRKYRDCFSLVLLAIGIHHVVMCFFTSWISNFQYFIYVILIIIGILFDVRRKKKIRS